MAKEPKEPSIEDMGEAIKQVKTIEERQLDFQERQLRIQERQLELQEAAIAAQKQTAIVQQQQLKQTAKPSLTHDAEVSAYNPQGNREHPMPPLKCEVWFPYQQLPANHGFDIEEVELLNRIEEGEYTIINKDEAPVKIVVIAEKNHTTGKVERLDFTRGYDKDIRGFVPLFNRFNQHEFPSLRSILRQILGERAEEPDTKVNVMTMKERYRRCALPEDHPDRLHVSTGA